MLYLATVSADVLGKCRQMYWVTVSADVLGDSVVRCTG